jgi:DNA invertase Pin-like site-specific DNA recombinase
MIQYCIIKIKEYKKMSKNKVYAYTRVSTIEQNIDSQLLGIKQYAKSKGYKIDEVFEHKISTRKSAKERGLLSLLEKVKEGDTIIFSEVTRVGRDLEENISFVNQATAKGVRIIFVKEGIVLYNKEQDFQSHAIFQLFSLFGNWSREMTKFRIKEGIENARRAGRKGGRPKGKLSSKLSSKREEIQELLEQGVPISRIANRYGVTRNTVYNAIKKYNLQKNHKKED